MTVVVRSSDEDQISIPSRLMEELHLREGEEIKATVQGETLRFGRLNGFLALRGALAGDSAFDDAMELIEHQWRAWTAPGSA